VLSKAIIVRRSGSDAATATGAQSPGAGCSEPGTIDDGSDAFTRGVRVSLCAGLAGVAVIAGAVAADLGPVKAPVAAWGWTGFHIGTHSGLALSRGRFDDPLGPSVFGDVVNSPGALIGAQVGYDWQYGPWVLGLEIAGGHVDAEGTATCLAVSGDFNSANCRVRPNTIATLTGRVGRALGPDGRALVYVRGGGAFVHRSVSVTNNIPFVGTGQTVSTTSQRFGGTIGAGIEYLLTPALSAIVEYDVLAFARETVTTPYALAGGGVDLRQGIHMARVGLNYRPGGAPAGAAFAAPATPAEWQVEAGARSWFSWGGFQKDLPGDTANDRTLVSRLTYQQNGHSNEIFGRVDTPWALPGVPWTLFVKGNIGVGRITSGHMNDEDWGLDPSFAYSNTFSELGTGSFGYLTADLGLNVASGPGYRVGWFAGYHRWFEQMSAVTCAQIASPASGICAPPIFGRPVITETTRWQSLRLGIVADVMLTDRLKLTADAAYLPYVAFRGIDNHWLRSLVIDEDGRGRGVQIEGILSYAATDHWRIGAGGRYWAVWTRRGGDAFNGVPVPRNDTYSAHRFGVFLQASYRFGPLTP
jgi:opacity protein-like surface antigen